MNGCVATLTPRQQRFVDEYLVDLNGTQAAIRAGFSKKNADSIAIQVLRKPQVAEAVAAAIQSRSKKVGLTAEWVVERLMSLADADVAELYDDHGNLLPMRDLPQGVRRAVSSVEVCEEWEGVGENRKLVGYTKKVKLWDKVKSLEHLGRHLGMFTDKVEVGGLEKFADEIASAWERLRAGENKAVK